MQYGCTTLSRGGYRLWTKGVDCWLRAAGSLVRLGSPQVTDVVLDDEEDTSEKVSLRGLHRLFRMVASRTDRVSFTVM